MRIAQVAPLSESVPPQLYGGTERVVSWLTEELVRQGHDVTLFASGDSRTTARLEACAPEGLRLSGIRDHTSSHLVMLDQVRRHADDFDVIHFHVDMLPAALFRDFSHKCLTTLHGRLDIPDHLPAYRAFTEMPLVSISMSQRAPMPRGARWLANIPHGLGEGACELGTGEGGYLAFLGRISPEKRPDRAIEIAKRAGVPLKLAAKVDPSDLEYFKETIEPLLDDPLVDFIGEIDDTQKPAFLENALALVFPIDWPEPFGLVMVEAMSAGTPVIAWRNGSVPEVVEDGVTGAIVDSLDEAVAAVDKVGRLDRRTVRSRFLERFTVERMAHHYVAAYERLLASSPPGSTRVAATLEPGVSARPQT